MKLNTQINSLLTTLVLLLPVSLYAAEEKAVKTVNAEPMSGQYLVQLILGLIVVVACILALAWFAKRFNHLQSSTNGMLRIIGGLSMGSRERVVLLQVGSEQVLVGVSPGRINTLHVLSNPIDDVPTSAPTDGRSFSDKLKDVMNAAKNNENSASVKYGKDNSND